MGDSESKFTPGFEPDHSLKPQSEENFEKEGVLAAYQKAVEFIREKPKRSYCIIGPGNWLKCWRTEEKAHLRVKPVMKNIVLCYHDDLDIKFPEGVDPDKITAKKSD